MDAWSEVYSVRDVGSLEDALERAIMRAKANILSVIDGTPANPEDCAVYVQEVVRNDLFDTREVFFVKVRHIISRKGGVR